MCVVGKVGDGRTPSELSKCGSRSRFFAAEKENYQTRRNLSRNKWNIFLGKGIV